MEFFFFLLYITVFYSVTLFHKASVKALEWIWRLSLSCSSEVTVGIVVQGGAAEALLKVALEEEEGGGRAGDVSSDWRCRPLHPLPPAFFLLLSFQFIWGAARSSVTVTVTAALLRSTGDSGDTLTPQTQLRFHPVCWLMNGHFQTDILAPCRRY